MDGGGWRECYTRRNRPGAATRGQQQPAVGHKSSKERPTRQGESSQHSAAAADGATGAGYPERGRERDRQKGKKGEARQANEGKCGRPAGRAVHAATNRGGRQQAPTPARQPAGRAGIPPAFLVLLGAREGSSVARSARCRGGHTSPGTPGRQQVAEPVSAGGLPATTTASASQGDTCTAQGGAGGSSTGSQARQQLAGGQGSSGQGGIGPEKTQIKNTQGVRTGREGERKGNNAGRGPMGVTHQVGVGLPRGGSPQKCQRQDQSR